VASSPGWLKISLSSASRYAALNLPIAWLMDSSGDSSRQSSTRAPARFAASPSISGRLIRRLCRRDLGVRIDADELGPDSVPGLRKHFSPRWPTAVFNRCTELYAPACRNSRSAPLRHRRHGRPDDSSNGSRAPQPVNDFGIIHPIIVRYAYRHVKHTEQGPD
jgi:hypothetical protein